MERCYNLGCGNWAGEAATWENRFKRVLYSGQCCFLSGLEEICACQLQLSGWRRLSCLGSYFRCVFYPTLVASSPTSLQAICCPMYICSPMTSAPFNSPQTRARFSVSQMTSSSSGMYRIYHLALQQSHTTTPNISLSSSIR